MITGPRFWNYGINYYSNCTFSYSSFIGKIKNELSLSLIIILILPVYLLLNISDHSNPDNTNIEYLENENIGGF